MINLILFLCSLLKLQTSLMLLSLVLDLAYYIIFVAFSFVAVADRLKIYICMYAYMHT